MTTEILRIDDPEQQKKDIERAAAVIRQGGLVVFPTETVYGLGGDATNADAAKKIYAAKGRPSDNPLIIHVATPEDAEPYAVTSETYYRLARAFMPGPLTVILPKKETIPYSVTGGLDSVAVRCPSDPTAHALIAAAGVPIAAPSANLSGKPSPTCAEHVIHDLDGRVDLILAGGECEIGLESTIVKLDGTKATLLRPGGITYDALCCVLDEVEIASAVTKQLGENERPLSPGMKYRHYAPASPVVLLCGEPDVVLDFCRKEAATRDALFLCYDEEVDAIGAAKCLPVGARNDLPTQAHKLFAALREADKRAPEIVYAHLPPTDGMGLALYNRMIRAAAHTVKEVK